MIDRDFSPLRSCVDSGFVAAQLIIATSKVREDVKQRRLRLKQPTFHILGESLLPVCDRGANRAGAIEGQTPVDPHSRGFMTDHFGESGAYLGRALQLQDCRLILPFGAKIYGPTDSAFG